jgi:hypothetical protein
LPLIEAAQWKLPVLARDIPVFREVAPHYATFFSADNTDEMACAVDRYVAQIKSGDKAEWHPLVYNTWKQSADQLMGEIMRDPALTGFHLNDRPAVTHRADGRGSDRLRPAEKNQGSRTGL